MTRTARIIIVALCFVTALLLAGAIVLGVLLLIGLYPLYTILPLLLALFAWGVWKLSESYVEEEDRERRER